MAEWLRALDFTDFWQEATAWSQSLSGAPKGHLHSFAMWASSTSLFCFGNLAGSFPWNRPPYAEDREKLKKTNNFRLVGGRFNEPGNLTYEAYLRRQLQDKQFSGHILKVYIEAVSGSSQYIGGTGFSHVPSPGGLIVAWLFEGCVLEQPLGKEGQASRVRIPGRGEGVGRVHTPGLARRSEQQSRHLDDLPWQADCSSKPARRILHYSHWEEVFHIT